MDQYRSKYYESAIRNLPPPPPPREMPPFQQRPPQRPENRPPNGRDSWRPPVPQTDFTFRNNASAPQFPKEFDRYQPSSDPQRRNNYNRRGNALNHRGWAHRRPTAERPLLSSNRGHSPEDVLGQADAQNKIHRFLPADDVSDSDEEDMDESDAEQQVALDEDQNEGPNVLAERVVNILDTHTASDSLEPPKKRRATAVNATDAKEAASVPKWSNPDPYTVLPPVDENARKRKDVVKIIRKARIAAEKELENENQVAANDDFISFGTEAGNEPGRDSRSPSLGPQDRDERRVPGVPTGQREFSHLNNLHASATDGAPGTSDQRPSAKDLGPPPTLKDQYPLRSGRNVSKPESRHGFYPEQTEALGNRKRTLDDDIKGDAIQTTRYKKPASNGSVLQQWIPRGDADPTPWLVADHRSTENPGFRLHKEICDFYEYVKPQKHEQIIREDLLQRLQTAIKKKLPDCDLYCFGSFAAEMYLPNADMDLVVISSTFRRLGQRVACQTQSQMFQFAHHLEKAGVAAYGSTQVIFKAKVPLVKFVDQMTGIQVDVSFENETGLVANETFNAWKRQFPAMPILTTVIKQFLKMRDLSEVVNGGLGGFSVTCLVTSLIQNLPRVQSGEIIPEQHLGEMLLEFFDLYGNQFDLARTGISMNPPGYYDKQAAERINHRREVYQGNRGSRLAIIDPNNRENDISGGSKNVSLIFDLFSGAYREIMEATRSLNSPSLLDWTLGGDYRSFTVQRRRLRDLFNSRWGILEPVQTPREIHEPVSSMPLSGGDDSRQGPTFSLSGLPGSIFSNPLDPDVVVQPKIVVKRKKQNKANENGPKQSTSNAQGNAPAAQGPSYKVRNRARKLKLRFPSVVAEIPDEVNKQMRRTIIEKARAAKIVPIETHASINAKQRKELREASGQVKIYKPEKAKKVKVEAKPKSMPKPKVRPQPKSQKNQFSAPYGVSEARLAETTQTPLNPRLLSLLDHPQTSRPRQEFNMGNDGGSIPTRRELVKEAAKDPSCTQVKEVQTEKLEHYWSHCALSQKPLSLPIVSDSTGNLYNKDAVLEHLLSAGKQSQDGTNIAGNDRTAGTIKSLKDVVEVRLDVEEEEDGDNSTKPNDSLRLVCPVSGKRLGPGVKAVYLVPCGHAFAESAVREMPGEQCLQCNEPYSADNVILILPTSTAEKDRLRDRLSRLQSTGLTHSLKKASGSGKKRKKDAFKKEEETTNVADVTAGPDLPPKEEATVPSSKAIRNEGTASLTAKVLAEQDDRNKRRKVAQNQNLKTLFSSSNAMAGKQKDFMTRGFTIPTDAKR
ncbi:MAG: hypothetical protein Q9210_002981 [Variospora velana]